MKSSSSLNSPPTTLVLEFLCSLKVGRNRNYSQLCVIFGNCSCSFLLVLSLALHTVPASAQPAGSPRVQVPSLHIVPLLVLTLQILTIQASPTQSLPQLWALFSIPPPLSLQPEKCLSLIHLYGSQIPWGGGEVNALIQQNLPVSPDMSNYNLRINVEFMSSL